MANHTGYIQGNDIFQGESNECTELFMKQPMILASRKAMKYIMSMVTRGTTDLITCKSSLVNRTGYIMAKKGLQIKNLQLSFREKEVRRLKNGMLAMRGGNGILSMEKNHTAKESISISNVSNVVNNTKRGTPGHPNSAIITARLLRLEHGEKKIEQVYDLMVEGQHEYFANGLLVHNCVDGIRYYFTTGKKYTGQYYTANV
jgi:hypothetical protein